MHELINDPELRRAFYATQAIAIDDFAEKHAAAIQRWYATRGRSVDLADAAQIACEVWGKLRRGEPFEAGDA